MVETRDSDSHAAQASGRRLKRLAWWLDSSIPLPGVNFRVGVDALIGLLPGIGDLIGVGLSSYILAEAARLGAPRAILMRMGVNIAIDALVGVVPVLGDVFDAVWKANQRNVRLLADYLEQPKQVRRGSLLVLLALLAGLLIFVGALGALAYVVLRWLFTSVF